MRLDRPEDAGAIALLVAVLATVMFGFAAIVVDLGYARTVNSDAQSTVDAASLAGAKVLATPGGTISDATNAIETSAKDNFGTTAAEWDACSATPPTPKWKQGGSGTPCILFNRNANNPSKLQVVLPVRHVDSFFGGLVGYGGMDVSVLAQATIREDDVPGCALCVQDLLETSGSVKVGPFDPDRPDGSSSAGSGLLHPGGSITVQPDGAITFATEPTPAKGPAYSPMPIIRPVTDPFAGSGHPEPYDPADPANVLDPWPTRNVTCGPGGDVTSLIAGTYRNITVVGPCTATGVIVITGPFQGLHIKSAGSLSAVSAAIQLSCGSRSTPTSCAGTAGGRLQIDSGGLLSMVASFPTEFSVVADPGNTAVMTINGDLSVDHAVYGRAMAVTLGAGASLSTSAPVSVYQLTVGSGGGVNVVASGEDPIPGPAFVGLYR